MMSGVETTRSDERPAGRAPERTAPPGRPSPEPGRDHSAADARQPIRVVIAEDSYLIREILTTTLASAPEVELVAVCSNGKELKTAIANWAPDVVLTDIRMPPSGADEGIRG